MIPADAARRFPLELLAPARDTDVARAAIDHGADAVYIGGPGFGARASAGNSLASIESFAAWAKNYHARIYLTLNTVLFQNEIEEARQLAWDAYRAGVDALIIQDLGLLELDLPPVELHASTQCDIRTPEKAWFLDSLGFNQMVLARELTLAEVARCREAVDRARIEFFVHGALCVSYSGRCYLSCAECGRSANRGECAQPCRLPYTVYDGTGRLLARNKHVLSLMDNDQSANLEKLIEAGVTSFKIEGRLKDAAYVKNITAYYREKLDKLIAAHTNDAWRAASLGHCTFTFTPDPARTFHRGETDYFVNGRRRVIAELDTPKSTGERIGRVVRLNHNPDTVDIKTEAEIANGDGLVYLDDHEELRGLAVNRAEDLQNGTVRLFIRDRLTAHPALKPGVTLNRNKDRVFAKTLAGDTSRRAIDTTLTFAFTDKELRVTAQACGAAGEARMPFDCQAARDQERTRTGIINALKKTGGTIFDAADVQIEAPAGSHLPFVPVSALNNLRREALTKLQDAVAASHPKPQLRHEPLDNASFKDAALDFTANAANSFAETFWRKQGVIAIASAAETDPAVLKDAENLMHTRHCIRMALGLCPRLLKGDEEAKARFKERNGGHLKPEPLYLTDSKGHRLIARFHCKPCEMTIGFAPAGSFPVV